MSSASHPDKRRPTYDDILALPEGVRGEIIAGELVAQPRPAPPHAGTASHLGGILTTTYRMGIGGPGGWWILDEPELSLDVDPDYDPVVPDLAGWRLSTLPNLPTTAQFHTRPDWVCEVLSPSTAGRDRLQKLPFYGRAGVGHCWIVDPIAHSIEVFRHTDQGLVLAATHVGDEHVALEPFDAVPIPLDKVWIPATPKD